MLLEDNSLQSNTKPTKPRFNQLWKRYQFGAVFGSHSRERRELTQSTGTESCTAANRPTLDRRPRLLSPATAEKAAGIAKQICPDTWIGIGAHDDSAGLTAGGPTDNIRFRRIARHGRYARRRVRESLVDIRTLPLRLPSIGRGRDQNAESANKQSKQDCPLVVAGNDHGISPSIPVRAGKLGRLSPAEPAQPCPQ
jgi:hypothetical protein